MAEQPNRPGTFNVNKGFGPNNNAQVPVSGSSASGPEVSQPSVDNHVDGNTTIGEAELAARPYPGQRSVVDNRYDADGQRNPPDADADSNGDAPQINKNPMPTMQSNQAGAQIRAKRSNAPKLSEGSDGKWFFRAQRPNFGFKLEDGKRVSFIGYTYDTQDQFIAELLIREYGDFVKEINEDGSYVNEEHTEAERVANEAQQAKDARRKEREERAFR